MPIAMLLAVVLGLATASPAAAFVQRAPSDFFGINGQELRPLANGTPDQQAKLESQLNGLEQTGVTWVRASMPWSQVEPAPPLLGSHVFDWTASDAWVTALARHGLAWDVDVMSPPVWSQDPATLPQCLGAQRQMLPPSDPANYSAVVAAAEKRYGRGGRFWALHPELPYRPITDYEVWNEENDKSFFCPKPDPALYAHMYRLSADAVHAVDPQARVTVGGLSPNRYRVAPDEPHADDVLTEDFLRGMIAAEPSLAGGIDAVGIHAYERDPADVLADVAWYRRVLEHVGLGSVPLDLNETGWHTQGGTSFDWVPEAQRAKNYHALTHDIGRTDCNLVGFAPFSWMTAEQNTSDPEDWFGIARQDGTPYPSGQAYADEVKLFLGQGPTPAPRTTKRYCGNPLPDTDGDGTPDQADDYPLDPSRQTGSGEHNPEDDPPPATRFQPNRVPDDFFGMTGIELLRGRVSESQHVHYTAMHKAGVGDARGIVSWRTIEPYPPSAPYHDYHWGEVDRSIRRAAMHGIRWRPTFNDPPSWALAASASTQARDEFASFLTAFAQRYGPGGSFWDENRGLPQLPVRDYEIWYRANIDAQWVDGSAAPGEYAAFYLAARSALHSVDPGATATMSLSESGVEADDAFLRDMVAARPDLRGAIDAVHLSSFRTTVPSLEGAVATLRSALDGGGNASAGITLELALPQAGSGAMTDAERQLRYQTLLDYLPRSDCGVTGVFPRAWFSAEQSTTNPEDWVGIARPNGAALYLAGEGYKQDALAFTGQTPARAAYATVHICNRPSPDTDGDGTPDQADDYPLDPTRTTGIDSDGDGIFDEFDANLPSPDVQIDSGPAGPTNDPSPSFAFSSSVTGATFQCALDGDPYSVCSSPKQYGSLPEGNHTFRVRAVDTNGNAGTAASRDFTVDTTAPVAQIDSGPSGPTNDASPSFGFHSGDATARFECSLDGAAFSDCSSPKQYSSLPDGNHSFQVRAVDLAGNTGAAASRDFTVDTSAPAAQIDSGPSGPTNNASPSFGFHSSDSTARFECSLDSGAFSACSSPKQYSSLPDGNHSFQVRAVDLAGNTGAAASRDFTVDTSAPAAQIDSGPSGPTNNASPSFGFHSSDSTARFECSLDSGAFSACSSPKKYSSLPEGAHTFRVRAIDPAGNIGAAATRSFTVDTTPPDTQITGGPSGNTSDRTPTFTFKAVNESGPVSFECRLDSASFQPCTSPHTTARLAKGAHTFQVRARDAAGNVDPSPASRSFKEA